MRFTIRREHTPASPRGVACIVLAGGTVARVLGEQSWLDGIGTPLQRAIRKLFESAGDGGSAAKKLLHGSALGHPLHPALIELPVGARTLAAIFDAIELAASAVRGTARDSACRAHPRFLSHASNES